MTVRLEPALEQLVLAEVARLNLTRTEEPYDLSSWIRDCVAERLTKRARRKGRKAEEIPPAK